MLSLGLRWWWWFDAEAEKEAARGLKTGEALLIWAFAVEAVAEEGRSFLLVRREERGLVLAVAVAEGRKRRVPTFRR